MDERQQKIVKSGWKTSEFWKTLMITGAGLGLVVYGAINNDESVMIIGAGVASLNVGAYTVSRGLAK